MEGAAVSVIAGHSAPSLYAVKPIDFPGLTPKMAVKTGDSVKAGEALFRDKLRPEILFTSPVNGKVVSIVRGERRKLLEVVVEKTGEDYVSFEKTDPSGLPAEKIKAAILQSGLWPAVRQRPYHIVADPATEPKSVFISGFDTAPLAPDYNFIMENSNISWYRTGISALSKLTRGKVNLILDGKTSSSGILAATDGVEISHVSGPHPAGNPGVQIHHIDPVNKGELVWFVNLQDVLAIGRLFEEGVYKPERLVALAGSEVKEPRYYRMLSGSSVSAVTQGNVKEGHLRYISGNVLTGTRVEPSGFLGYYDSQITVIPEGDYHEFFGWVVPGMDKLSFFRTFMSSFMPGRKFRPDTNFHGGERAFVLTGQYEKVVPMDIYPMQLLKAILAEDIEAMENLGIYEVAAEDFALCEFICPSKIEIQSIVNKGLELMMKEMN